MNLRSVYAHAADEFALPRPQKTLACPDFELICLAYEEALKRGWDANYGSCPDSDDSFLEVFDCSLNEFCEILKTAQANRSRITSGLAGQKALPLEFQRPRLRRVP